MLLPRLGAKVLLCGPERLLPEDARGLGEGVEIVRDFDGALRRACSEGLAVAMMLRIQKERLAGLELNLGDYIARYQLNAERLAACAPEALVMHPGPMIRGMEITGDVADGANSAIEDQVTHGLAVRSALLVRALGVGGFESVRV
jgi:aspartate carbamoyltransferase catalytic subunit